MHKADVQLSLLYSQCKTITHAFYIRLVHVLLQISAHGHDHGCHVTFERERERKETIKLKTLVLIGRDKDFTWKMEQDKRNVIIRLWSFVGGAKEK